MTFKKKLEKIGPLKQFISWHFSVAVKLVSIWCWNRTRQNTLNKLYKLYKLGEAPVDQMLQTAIDHLYELEEFCEWGDLDKLGEFCDWDGLGELEESGELNE